MLDWLIITADQANAGRGVRGYALAWFLRTYFGRRHVGLCTPDQWRGSQSAADTLFIGLPSSLTAEEIERLGANGRYRRIVAFDYLDRQELQWTPEQEAVLRRLTPRYLKPWNEAAWDHGLQMGLLPLRRYGVLTAAIMADRCARKIAGPPTPRFDVAFLGQPNETRVSTPDGIRKISQRFHWVRQLKEEAPELKFWGGLMGGSRQVVAGLRDKYGEITHLYHPRDKVNFASYYQAMRHSRVLLAPGGNVPWTYRHYECLYAGGVVVTIDFRQREMLVPLPRQGMVHVADDAPVLPAVREALELGKSRPTLSEEYYAHLERYLRFGAYSRSRPLLMDRFIKQLE